MKITKEDARRILGVREGTAKVFLKYFCVNITQLGLVAKLGSKSS